MKNIKEVELFLFDMDGTVYIGDKEIEGSFDALRELKKLGKKVCFFTNNSSRAASDYVARLHKMGYEATENDIYTSSMVTCEYIRDHYRGKTVYLLGNLKLAAEFEKYGIKLVDENPDLLVLGFDTSLTYDRLYKFCIFLKEGKPYIATHPDMVCPAEPADMPDIGAMMLMIEATTGRKPDIVMGKPETPAGDGVKKRFGLPAEKIAMVGDRLYTDIAFGVNNGFVSVLVYSGETTPEMYEKSDVKADYALGAVREIPSLLK